MTIVGGIVGIVLMTTFLGFLVWWIRALPFTIISVFVVLLMLYDFVRTLRAGDSDGGR